METYAVVGNALLWGLIIPIIGLRFAVKSAPELYPVMLFGFLAEAVLSLILLYWWLGLLFAVLFFVHLVFYSKVYRHYSVKNLTAAEYNPSWARPTAEMQIRTDLRRGYHRPERVNERTGEFPQLKSKS